MPKSSVNASLSSYDDIFSTEESRQEEQREQVRQIPIGELFPFKNHPFKVLDDDSMSDTVESVKQYGVLSPLIARPRPKGGYEIISGHRRQHAAELAGLETLPVIVRQMDDDAAIILMVDSNLQREHMLASPEVSNIFENSDFVYMLNQANGDRQILAKQLNISPHQLSYVTHSGEGEGLLFFGNVILPFVDHFPKDLELYRILTTRLSEVVEAKHE